MVFFLRSIITGIRKKIKIKAKLLKKVQYKALKSLFNNFLLVFFFYDKTFF